MKERSFLSPIANNLRSPDNPPNHLSRSDKLLWRCLSLASAKRDASTLRQDKKGKFASHRFFWLHTWNMLVWNFGWSFVRITVLLHVPPRHKKTSHEMMGCESWLSKLRLHGRSRPAWWLKITDFNPALCFKEKMSQPRTLSRCSDTRIRKENTSFPFPTPAATQVEPYLVGRGAGNGNGVHFLLRGPIFLSCRYNTLRTQNPSKLLKIPLLKQRTIICHR